MKGKFIYIFMKKIFLLIVLSLSLTGCKFSPFSNGLDQKVDNQQGKIDELNNNQQGFLLELGKLKQENQIIADKIDNMQQGLINHNNSGVQILQGDGALLLVFSVFTIGMILLYHYYSENVKHQKAAEILAQSIADYDDAELEKNVYTMALNSPVEGHIYKIMNKKS